MFHEPGCFLLGDLFPDILFNFLFVLLLANDHVFFTPMVSFGVFFLLALHTAIHVSADFKLLLAEVHLLLEYLGCFTLVVQFLSHGSIFASSRLLLEQCATVCNKLIIKRVFPFGIFFLQLGCHLV